jgi:hypothetical protein
MAGPWRVPADGRSDRVMVGFAPLVALHLPSGTGNPAPARPRSDRRGSDARRAPFHEVRRPFSAPTLESSLPGTWTRVRACGVAPRTVDLSPGGDSPSSGRVHGSVRHPLPDDRRIGCRDGRRPGPEDARSLGNGRRAVVPFRPPSRPATSRGPLRSVAKTGKPRPSLLRGATGAARPDGSWFLVASFQARFVPPAPFLTTLAGYPSPGPSGVFHPVTLVGFGSGWNHPQEGPRPGSPRAVPVAVTPGVGHGPSG